ncbi:hypothetical protein EDC39_11428 [Geothermobacter ehrlichii]|uniref:Uncharacterized protein n=1 Tax=Geothermobacter ehrlichii TaxID=213224 RepID=A0A5D3WH74_9BACT|nr:hypothetical protein [Geothermobacter ehrlichii]TYO96323.1 hypothetical protein EDC39_11428 [Geothermobacter ehrlichii]
MGCMVIAGYLLAAFAIFVIVHDKIVDKRERKRDHTKHPQQG